MIPDTSLEAFIERIKKQDLKEIPEPPITFLEIMGCENKEFISSNLLAFFLDNRKPHQLKDLCLKTLLSLYSPEYSDKSFSVKHIDTEVVAYGKRIDILIKTEDELIIIENKIFNDINNPFKEYEKYAKDQIKKSQKEGKALTLVEILLTLKLNKVQKQRLERSKTQFKPITHTDFLDKLKEPLVNHQPTNNYILLLNQYIETMDKKNKNSLQHKTFEESANFIRANIEELENLEKIKERAYSYYEQQLKEVLEVLSNEDINPFKWHKISRNDSLKYLGVYSYSHEQKINAKFTYQLWLAINISTINIGICIYENGSRRGSYQNTKKMLGNTFTYCDDSEEVYILEKPNNGLSSNEILKEFIKALQQFNIKELMRK